MMIQATTKHAIKKNILPRPKAKAACCHNDAFGSFSGCTAISVGTPKPRLYSFCITFPVSDVQCCHAIGTNSEKMIKFSNCLSSRTSVPGHLGATMTTVRSYAGLHEPLEKWCCQLLSSVILSTRSKKTTAVRQTKLVLGTTSAKAKSTPRFKIAILFAQ